MVKVHNLTKDFKSPVKYEGLRGAFKSLISNKYEIKRAVDAISFQIGVGEMVGYIGVNGAGKSTTIKMLTGIMAPTSGQCLVDNREPFKNRLLNASIIGVVFGQRTQLWWDLPVSESFGILQKIYDIPLKVYQENLEYFKSILGLDEFYLTPVRNLSLGQKMRADLTASLLHNPKILFLDEPTIGLDILVKDRIRKAIKDINQKNKTTVLLTTHDLDDIEEICKKIIVIDKGKKIFDGPIKYLKEKYGKYREVKFLFKDSNIQVPDLIPLLKADKKDMRQVFQNNELVLKFNKNTVPISSIISKIVNMFDIKDITIEEPQMEDIVKEIYEGKIDFKE